MQNTWIDQPQPLISDRRPVTILGIHSGHDAACCMIRDGTVVADAQEERFSRIKHSCGVPVRSLAYCLSAAGLSNINDVDCVAVGSRHLRPDLAAVFGLSPGPALPATRLKPPVYLQRFYLRDSDKLLCVEHHLAHAASAHYTRSSAEPCLVFTMDGEGDGVCTAVWRAENNGIAPLQKLSLDAAIGWAYSIVTEGLGWRHGDGEGKTMGLAPYGNARKSAGVLDQYFPTLTSRSVEHSPLGKSYFWSDCGAMHWHFEEAGEIQALLKSHSAEDLAAEAQRKLEGFVVPYVRDWIETTGIRRTAYAGGVFLNVKLNQRIWTSIRGLAQEQHIFPNPGDGGLALGAALYAYYRQRAFVGSALGNTYWGPEYSDSYIADLLRLRKIPFEDVADPSAPAAEMLANGSIIGWFQGRMESGPRALGNRSILMAPAPAQNKDRVNATIKFREPFRPFCPSILWEKRGKYLLDARDEHFMITSFDVDPSYRTELAAVVHVDGTVRPQMVTRQMNDRFWRLIKNFGERTGTFAVLNTSMNLKGEPIVNTPSEAIRLFFDSGLDAIFLGRLLIQKSCCGH